MGIVGFAWRTVLRAYVDTRNDLSDPYCASRLWLRGQNPYDVRLATQESARQIHSEMRLVPVYPPSAYVVVAPLGLFPWKLANLVWAVLGLLAIGGMAYLLPRIAGLSWEDDRAWVLAACVFCAAPLHTALHAGNSAVIVIWLGLVAVYLVQGDRDFWAGVVTAIAICLKPQLGIWVFALYGFRRRWSMVVPAFAIAAVVSVVALVRVPLSPSGLLQNYSSNLHFWFRPGGMNDFSTANPLRFQLLNLQVVFAPWVHSTFAANVLAWTTFGIGLGLWLWTMRRPHAGDELLALSSLLMLGMLPVYHRSYDGAAALLGLAWLLKEYRKLGLFFYVAVLPVAVLASPPLSLIARLGKNGGQYPSGLMAGVSAFACFVFALELILALHFDVFSGKGSAVSHPNPIVTAEAVEPVTESALAVHS